MKFLFLCTSLLAMNFFLFWKSLLDANFPYPFKKPRLPWNSFFFVHLSSPWTFFFFERAFLTQTSLILLKNLVCREIPFSLKTRLPKKFLLTPKNRWRFQAAKKAALFKKRSGTQDDFYKNKTLSDSLGGNRKGFSVEKRRSGVPRQKN